MQLKKCKLLGISALIFNLGFNISSNANTYESKKTISNPDPDLLMMTSTGCIVSKEDVINCNVKVYGLENRFPVYCDAEITWYNPAPLYYDFYHKSYPTKNIEHEVDSNIVFSPKNGLYEQCHSATKTSVIFACISFKTEPPYGFGMKTINNDIDCEK